MSIKFETVRDMYRAGKRSASRRLAHCKEDDLVRITEMIGVIRVLLPRKIERHEPSRFMRIGGINHDILPRLIMNVMFGERKGIKAIKASIVPEDLRLYKSEFEQLYNKKPLGEYWSSDDAYTFPRYWHGLGKSQETWRNLHEEHVAWQNSLGPQTSAGKVIAAICKIMNIIDDVFNGEYLVKGCPEELAVLEDFMQKYEIRVQNFYVLKHGIAKEGYDINYMSRPVYMKPGKVVDDLIDAVLEAIENNPETCQE